jgi:hypothetical protein
LDKYICDLYDQYFVRPVRQGDCVKFTVDFVLLLRWLFKTVYNQARARQGGWPTSALAQFREYIVGKKKERPTARLLLQLIRSFTIEPGTLKENPTATEAPLLFNRIAIIVNCFLSKRAGSQKQESRYAAQPRREF